MEAGSLVDENGDPVTEDVTVEVTYIDPEGQELDAFTGGDFMAVVASTENPGEEDDVILETVALMEVTITGQETGTQYEDLDLDSPATVEMDIPADQEDQFAVGETIPLWAYDEDAGVWREEGEATVFDINEGTGSPPDLWARGEVNHFTWWNLDYPATAYCYRGRLVKCGTTPTVPITSLTLYAEGVTYNGYNGSNRGNGYFCASVKRSTATSTEIVVFSTNLSGQKHYLQDDGAGCYDLVTDKSLATQWTVPNSGGSCWRTSSLCGNLGDLPLNINFPPVLSLSAAPLILKCTQTSTITATASDPDGDYPLSYAWSALDAFSIPSGTITGSGASITWDPNPDCPDPFSQYPVTISCTTTDSLGASTTKNITLQVIDNFIPYMTSLTRTPTTSPVLPAQNITINGLAQDDDGTIVDYEWSCSSGGTMSFGVFFEPPYES